MDKPISYAENKNQTVHVVLDSNFGERLHEIKSYPVWIAKSSINEPVIQALWALEPTASHLNGITAFNWETGANEENRFLGKLETIDLHHGPYSSEFSYTSLVIIGFRLTDKIREALSKIGFSDFTETIEGFTARRSLEEAKKVRSD